mgnify:CR=1 FL=1
MAIEYQSIGQFRTKLHPRSGAPRQGALHPENSGIIELDDRYAGTLEGLEKSEYIIVLYHLHLSGNWHTTVRPPGSTRSFGLFATRSPNRPNPIGFSVVKLNRIKGNALYVSGVDAFDGTPVLDIKPFLPSIDCPEEYRNSGMTGLEKEVGL